MAGGRLTLIVSVIVLLAVAVTAVALLTGRSAGFGKLAAGQASGGGSAPAAPEPTPAVLGTYPGQQQRGVFEALSRVVASGDTIVAVGSQASASMVRPQFFVSTNRGRTWHLATVRAPAAGGLPLGHPATLLAGGPGRWAAVGPQALWTSQDGTSWTLAAPHGIVPRRPGDQVWVLTKTSRGFVAAGEGAAGRGTTQAVIWTSPDGQTWHRMTAAQLGLAAPGERVLNIAYATWHGADTVITGAVAAAGSTYSGAWRSTDGGSTWSRVQIPVSHGATTAINGVAYDAGGLIAVRAGHAAGGMADGVAFYSPDGLSWRYAGTVGAPGGLFPLVIKGSDDGFVAAGPGRGGQLEAYISTDRGTTWLPTAPLGAAAAETISVTTAPGGTAVVIGATTPSRTGQQAVFLEADTAGAIHPVSPARIPGAVFPAVAVDGLAIAAGAQVAVGAADGYPAIWRRAPGGASWDLVSSLALVSARPGLAVLTSVTHGPAGWLAVGVPGPVVLTSATGTAWRSAGGAAAAARGLAGVAAVAAAAGPAGYVIVGKLVAPGGGCVADVWWSPNLTDWTRAHDLNDVAGSSQVLAVAATAAGFVSVGSHDGRPAVWTTADGRAWTTAVLPSPAGASSAVLQYVAVNGERVVALGQAITRGGAVPLAEFSADSGGHWQPVPFAAPAAITALTADAAGFTAAGQAGPSGRDLAAWISATGSAWTPARLAGASGGEARDITALAASGPAAIGIGSVVTQASQRVFVWAIPARR